MKHGYSAHTYNPDSSASVSPVQPVQQGGLSSTLQSNSGFLQAARNVQSSPRSIRTASGTKLRSRYSKADEVKFWQMVNDNESDQAIATELGKTVNAITTKRKRKAGLYADAHASDKTKKTRLA